MRLTVDGMTCGHCARTVRQVVERLGGTAEVDVGAGCVTVEGPVDVDHLIGALAAEGYGVTSVDGRPVSG